MTAPITLSASIARNTYILGEQVFTGEMVFNYLVDVLGYSEEDATDELKNGTEWVLGTMSEAQREECYNFAQ